METSSFEGSEIDVALWDSKVADSKERSIQAPSSSSSSGGGSKGIIYDSKGISAATDSKNTFSGSDAKDAKEQGGYHQAPSSSSITSSPSNSTNSASVNMGGGGVGGEVMRVTNYYSESDSEEEEIRDEQGRILHSYLSKEELAAMQEALAEENTVKLDTKEIINLKEAFDIFDKDSSGSIDYGELEHLMRMFRKEVSPEEVKKMMNSCGDKNREEISFQEFVPLMAPVFKLNERDGAILDAFNVFDLDQNGFLSAKELRQLMMSLGDSDITEAEVDDMISLVDRDGDGQISFTEFKEHILKDPNSVMADIFEESKKKNDHSLIGSVGGFIAEGTTNTLRRSSVMFHESLASLGLQGSGTASERK